MKIKRILSVALASMMALSLTTTAFAAEGDAEEAPSNQTVITATYSEQETAVDVPGTVTGFINPYGVDVVTVEGDEDSTMSGFQILSAPAAIVNKSAMDLSVNVSVTGAIPLAEGVTAANGMKFATAATNGEGTVKQAFVQVQFKKDEAITGVSTAVDAAMIQTQAVAWAADGDADGEVTVKVGATAAEDVTQLKKATTDESDNLVVSAGGAALVRLNGDCVTAPKVAWAETDTFNVTIAYTFMPTTIEEPAA